MEIICGIEIGGNAANIILLKGDKQEYEIIKTEFKKIVLDNDNEQSQIKSFYEAMENFVRQNKIDKLFIRKPSTSGKYTSSPTAFKIEAILQLLSSVYVELLHPSRIASIIKKHNIPNENYEAINKYQKSAFDVAFCGLEDKHECI